MDDQTVRRYVDVNPFGLTVRQAARIPQIGGIKDPADPLLHCDIADSFGRLGDKYRTFETADDLAVVRIE